MVQIDFNSIVREAVKNYDDSREVTSVMDISAKVSTNHVYRIKFADDHIIIAKLSYFGKYEHFVEDHSIINALATNLPSPYENVLARSLIKGNSLFVYRHQTEYIDAWVVFYKPMEVRKKLPKRLNENQIQKLGKSIARFHKACYSVKNTLPESSKTLSSDIYHLLEIMKTKEGQHEYRMHQELIKTQCWRFLENLEKLGMSTLNPIPVFVDWNIGNFSVNKNFEIFSRWDYDWFRVSTRIMDFYFLSRVVSEVGDQTIFSYDIDRLTERRFILFLKSYHEVNPLTEKEIRFMKEAYRFFLLNYVVKYGRYFFHEIFATRLQQETYDEHLPAIDDKFDPDPILNALNI